MIISFKAQISSLLCTETKTQKRILGVNNSKEVKNFSIETLGDCHYNLTVFSGKIRVREMVSSTFLLHSILSPNIKTMKARARK